MGELGLCDIIEIRERNKRRWLEKNAKPEIDKLNQRLAELDCKGYNYASKRNQKQIRAEVMSENLDRWFK